MSSPNRATRISKLHSLLKKAYKPIIPVDNRRLLEHLLYACLLENAPYELADEALAKLEQDYFDWNEVRVTTITELAEVLNRLPDPTSAAVRLKKNLHGLFESFYTFDIEELRKQNLGKALQRFERLPAMTPFVLDYLTQHGLGGHAIPLDSAALRFFWFADIISESELKTGRITGLERAIPKNKGVEFASLLHQAAVAINVDPNDKVARSIVLTLNPALDQQLADLIDRRRGDKAQKEGDAPEKAETAPPQKAAASTKPKEAKGGPKGSVAVETSPAAATKQTSATEGKRLKAEPTKSEPKATPTKSKPTKSTKPTASDKPSKANSSETAKKDTQKKSSRRPKTDEVAAAPKKTAAKTPPQRQPVTKKKSAKSTEKSSPKKPSTKAASPQTPKKKTSSPKAAPAKSSSKKIAKKKPR